MVNSYRILTGTRVAKVILHIDTEKKPERAFKAGGRILLALMDDHQQLQILRPRQRLSMKHLVVKLRPTHTK
ncbi:hypothetical protein AU467_23805 [Mesorhizobium loti]|uniref:Uncharacterized protein n=1 Tax=Rhizobium loti TaxID=381 RepID=A0A101KRT7_RHILI|nr:hypothetical protein AU467_23805 [Mesorhizobium loti]